MAYTNIDLPSDYFNTVLYTGTGSSGNAITGVGFQPDFLWIKNRTSSSGHVLMDVIRGISSGLSSNTTAAENIASYLNSFDTDGFNIAATGVAMNSSGNNFASWNWKANGAGVSNTDGSITSTVSANTTSGFSIVSYTGTGSVATVGHGLGTTPSMIIIKKRNAAEDWMVYHKSLTATNYIKLNLTDQTFANSVVWNNTEPTSSFFTIATSGAVNTSSATYIAYCFAEKKGLASLANLFLMVHTDGTFIYTGFKPAFLMAKSTQVDQEDWRIMFDNKINQFNAVDN
jgi:hypothetical protein